MKKTITLDIEAPDFLDKEFITLLSLLTSEERHSLKIFVKGALFGSGRYTLEQIEAISKANIESR